MFKVQCLNSGLSEGYHSNFISEKKLKIYKSPPRGEVAGA